MRSDILEEVDLSWCQGISGPALGLLADSCPRLLKLRLFGCSQVGTACEQLSCHPGHSCTWNVYSVTVAPGWLVSPGKQCCNLLHCGHATVKGLAAASRAFTA